MVPGCTVGCLGDLVPSDETASEDRGARAPRGPRRPGPGRAPAYHRPPPPCSGPGRVRAERLVGAAVERSVGSTPQWALSGLIVVGRFLRAGRADRPGGHARVAAEVPMRPLGQSTSRARRRCLPRWPQPLHHRPVRRYAGGWAWPRRSSGSAGRSRPSRRARRPRRNSSSGLLEPAAPATSTSRGYLSAGSARNRSTTSPGSAPGAPRGPASSVMVNAVAKVVTARKATSRSGPARPERASAARIA